MDEIKETSAANDSKREVTFVANNGQVVNPETEANLNQDTRSVLEDNLLPPITPPEELPKPEPSPKHLYNLYLNKFKLDGKDPEEESYEDQTEAIEQARITTKTKLNPPETLLSIGDVSFIERGDIYEIKGDPKTGKTSAIKALIGAILFGECCGIKAKEKNLKVAHMDTEQKPEDTQGILNYVQKIAGEDADEHIDSSFGLYALRMRDHTTLGRDLLHIVVNKRPDIIILDGIADFVNSFNDEIESKAIILLLLRIVHEFKCAIICLIHENKSRDDHNSKGHTGQLLTQKCAIELETTISNNIIKVHCTKARHKSIPDLYLMYDENDMLCDATEPYKERTHTELVETKYLKVAQDILNEKGSIKRSELSKLMAEKTGKKPNWMATQITTLKGKGLYLVGDMVQLTPSEPTE